MSEEFKNKKIIRKPKSRPYPYYSLEEALNIAKAIYKIGGNGATPINSILSELDLKSASNKRFTYLISSALQYGFIEKENDGFKIIESTKLILYPSDLNDPIHKNLIIQALMRPLIFRELIMQFKGMKLPKEEYLKNIFAKKNIIESSLGAVCKSFMDSLSYAKLLSSDNGIIDNEDLNSIIENYDKNQNLKQKERSIPKELNNLKMIPNLIKNKDTLDNKILGANEKNFEKVNSLNKVSEEFFKIEIPFSSGKLATLIIPKDCKENDITLLQNFINAISQNITKS